MGKILLLAIGVWLLITVIKRYGQNMQNPSSQPGSPEDMVQCAYCNVHLPKSDGLLIGNQYYCCEAHSKQVHDHHD